MYPPFIKGGFMDFKQLLCALNNSLKIYTTDNRPLHTIELSKNTYDAIIKEVMPPPHYPVVDNFIIYGVHVKRRVEEKKGAVRIKGPREP